MASVRILNYLVSSRTQNFIYLANLRDETTRLIIKKCVYFRSFNCKKKNSMQCCSLLIFSFMGKN